MNNNFNELKNETILYVFINANESFLFLSIYGNVSLSLPLSLSINPRVHVTLNHAQTLDDFKNTSANVKANTNASIHMPSIIATPVKINRMKETQTDGKQTRDHKNP